MSSENAQTETRRSFIEQARRRQIVDVTMSTIAELGYPAASLATIARRAGISKGVISYHFVDKDELITTVLIGIYTEIGTAMAERISAETTATAALATYIRTNLAFFCDNLVCGQALREILTHFHPKVALLPEHEMRDEESVAAIEPILAWGQETGEFGAFSTRIVAIMIRRSIDGLLEYWSHHQDHDLDAYIDELVALIARITRADPP